MASFEPVLFEWNGTTHQVQADGILRLVAQIEDAVSATDIMASVERRRLPAAKLSIAYGIALRAFGVKVTDLEIYHAMVRSPELIFKAFDAIAACYTRIAPPMSMQEEPGKASGGDAKSPEASSPSATGSSSAANPKQ
jgi:hypothetical protein